MSSLDIGRILDDTARKLREGLAEFCDSLSLHLESALLRHRTVPAKIALDT